MTLGLTLIDGEFVEVIVGDATPDGRSYYIGVLERLVTDPPYPPPDQKAIE